MRCALSPNFPENVFIFLFSSLEEPVALYTEYSTKVVESEVCVHCGWHMLHSIAKATLSQDQISLRPR